MDWREQLHSGEIYFPTDEDDVLRFRHLFGDNDRRDTVSDLCAFDRLRQRRVGLAVLQLKFLDRNFDHKSSYIALIYHAKVSYDNVPSVAGSSVRTPTEREPTRFTSNAELFSSPSALTVQDQLSGVKYAANQYSSPAVSVNDASVSFQHICSNVELSGLNGAVWARRFPALS